MGTAASSLREAKISFERKLNDNKRELVRVLSKSNSMESLDKSEVTAIKHEIGKAESTLGVINRAIEDENAPSF
jgi:hypothetical protein